MSELERTSPQFKKAVDSLVNGKHIKFVVREEVELESYKLSKGLVVDVRSTEDSPYPYGK